MMEEVRRFGSDAHLAGIVSLPDNGHAREHAVIFITAGLLHKPGPYRLHVELSRMLAANGLAALRFDVSGIGESGRRPGSVSAEQAALEDVRAAMDMMAAEAGVARFLLVGLCSGAEVAHRAACADERVIGLVALDGYVPRTRRFYLHHYLPRLLSWRKWRDALRARWRRLFGAARDADAEESALMFWGGNEPDRAVFATELAALCRRGVRQLQVFSGGSGDCSYIGQYQDAFPQAMASGRIDVRFHGHADHMYVLGEDRRALARDIVHWVRRHFLNDAQRAAADALSGRLHEPRPHRAGDYAFQPRFGSARSAERRKSQ